MLNPFKQRKARMGLSHLGIVKNYSEEYEGGDDSYYIEHIGLISILVKSIQELSERLEAVERAVQ